MRHFSIHFSQTFISIKSKSKYRIDKCDMILSKRKGVSNYVIDKFLSSHYITFMLRLGLSYRNQVNSLLGSSKPLV